MSIFELKECDVISTVYTVHPSYSYEIDNFTNENESDPIFIFSSSQGLTRDYFDVNNNPVTGSSYNLSGVITWTDGAAFSSSAKRAIKRLRDTYALNEFRKPLTYISGGISLNWYEGDNFFVIYIPQVLFGTEIKPGSFAMDVFGTQEFYDDGMGGVFNSSDNAVGNIFYQHGLILMEGSVFSGVTWTVNFSGTHKIPVNIYNCRVPRGGLNFSNNPSYTSFLSSSNRDEISTKNPKTFVTSVQLYDDEYNLVGEAKVSNPILNEEDTGLLFKLKLNF